MAAVKGRTHRRAAGGGAPSVILSGRVPEHVRDAARAAADAMGLSMAQYMEALVLADEEGRFVRPSAPRYEQEAMTA